MNRAWQSLSRILVISKVIVVPWQQDKNDKEAREETERNSGIYTGEVKDEKEIYEKGTEKMRREPPVFEFGGEVTLKEIHWGKQPVMPGNAHGLLTWRIYAYCSTDSVHQ